MKTGLRVKKSEIYQKHGLIEEMSCEEKERELGMGLNVLRGSGETGKSRGSSALAIP